jgi:para-aminobenzoate synthetase component I
MLFSRFRWNQGVLELTGPEYAYVYFRHRRFNLLTGFPEAQGIHHLLVKLEETQLQTSFAHPVVYHFYYELGLLQQGLGHSVGEDVPLAVEIGYRQHSFKTKTKARLKTLGLKVLERPAWSEYREAFAKVQQELLDGNCYQVNLTYPFDFISDDLLDPRDIADFFFSCRELGAYAHATYLGEEMILSNSPECLFHYEKGKLISMPIKGSLARSGDFAADWKSMLADPKQEGELLMITDLMKNDLNRLDRPCARVEKLRAPLLVPGILHQYSLIGVELKRPVSLARTLEALFPGGSITGAPKKRVMQIIQELERYQRGIYCGSTLLCLGEKKVASINIRTALVNPGERLWRYGAGGGVTLLSRPHLEFQEMEAKVASFLTMLRTPGYVRKGL